MYSILQTGNREWTVGSVQDGFWISNAEFPDERAAEAHAERLNAPHLYQRVADLEALANSLGRRLDRLESRNS